MKVAFILGVTLIAIYAANVICCKVFCEMDENAEIAKHLVYIMPFLVVSAFFHFAFTDQVKKYSRIQKAIGFISVPAKNYFVVQCCAEVCREKNRSVIYNKNCIDVSIPKMSKIVGCFENEMQRMDIAQ